MGRDVPLARRNLFQDRRHTGLSVAGVAVSLLLVLVLDGILAGAVRQTTAYLRDRSPDVIVAQRGVRTMHMSASSLPEDVTAAIRQVGASRGPNPSGSPPAPCARPGGATSVT